MTIFTLYLALYHAGLTLKTDGQMLTVTPAERLNNELRESIQNNKPALIELLQSARHTTNRLRNWMLVIASAPTASNANQLSCGFMNQDVKPLVGKASAPL